MSYEKNSPRERTAHGTAERSGAWTNIQRLAARELRVTWPSYLATGAVVLFLGLIASGFWIDGFSSEVFGVLLGDLFFVLITANLALNWVSVAYAYPWRAPFSGRLAFLRNLPIEVREIVAGRGLTMVLSVVVMSFLFFLPQYLMPGALGAQAGLLQALWFAGVWAGYSLLFGGVHLYLELGFRGKTIFKIQAVWTLLLVSLIVLLDILLDLRIVLGALELAREYGPLPAGVALLVSGAGFTLFAAAAARRLHRRDLTA